jgi:uncharacterized protein YraI
MSRVQRQPLAIGIGLAVVLLATSLALFWWFTPADDDPLAATLDAGAVIAAPTATVTTAPTTTTTMATTTTTTQPDPVPAVAATLCVTGLDPDQAIAIHIGPGTDYAAIGEIPYDGVDIGFTGASGEDLDGAEWLEIHYDGATGWAPGNGFSPGACTTEPVTTYSVIGIPCRSNLNVRSGIGIEHERLGTLQPDASDVAGTGYSALDDQDRNWVRVRFADRVAWVAGWYLTSEPLEPGRCT